MKRGFLPESDPAASLPGEYAAWEETAHELPKLLASGTVRRALDHLPRLDATPLTTSEALAERGMLHLEYADRYIHQQHQKSAANPSEVGTGGTPFMQYLEEHRETTLRHLL